GLEAVVGESRARGSEVAREACCSRRRADGAEAVGVEGREDADAGKPVLEGGVEDKLAPASRAGGLERGELVPGGSCPRGVDGEFAAADPDGAEQVAVAGELA